MKKIKMIWEEIKTFCSENELENCSELNPGIPEEALSEWEQKLGSPLPDDYKTVLQINNGEKNSVKFFKHLDGSPFSDFNGILPIEKVYSHWQEWQALGEEMNEDFKENEENFRKEIDKEIQPIGFHKEWIPIFPIASGDVCCIDMAPTAEGTAGQIIRVAHDGESRKVIAPSFETFLKKYFETFLEYYFAKVKI